MSFLKRAEVIERVQAHREQLQQLGVKSLDLFGSVARDEARPGSDIDFLVEFEEPGGYFQLFQVRHYLEELLDCKIDLGTQDSLGKHIRMTVSKDVLRVI